MTNVSSRLQANSGSMSGDANLRVEAVKEPINARKVSGRAAPLDRRRRLCRDRRTQALTAASRIAPPGILLPNAAVCTLDDKLGLLALRQLSSALNRVSLAVMEGIRPRRAVGLDGPLTAWAGFDGDLGFPSHACLRCVGHSARSAQ